MKYKNLCIILLIISFLFILTALIMYKDISFQLIGLSIILIGIVLKIWLKSRTFK